jgi:hypothetical protein
MTTFIIRLAALLLIPLLHSEATPPTYLDLTVIVPSLDTHEEIWPTFFTQLFKKWPDIPTPVLLGTAHKKYADRRVSTIFTTTDWVETMQQLLLNVRTRYVLILLDDYILYSPVDTERFAELYQAMRKHQAASLLLFVEPQAPRVGDDFGHITGLREYNQTQHLRASLQAGIWDKEVLASLLKAHETPWQFEQCASLRSADLSRPFLTIAHTPPFLYANLLQKGEYEPTALALLADHHIYVPTGTLPIRSRDISSWARLRIRIQALWQRILPKQDICNY